MAGQLVHRPPSHRCNKDEKVIPILTSTSKYMIRCSVCGRSTRPLDRDIVRRAWVEDIETYPIYYNIAHSYSPDLITKSGIEFRGILRDLILESDHESRIIIDVKGVDEFPLQFIKDVFQGYVEEYQENPLKSILFVDDSSYTNLNDVGILIAHYVSESLLQSNHM